MGTKRSKNQLRREKAKLRKTAEPLASFDETKILDGGIQTKETSTTEDPPNAIPESTKTDVQNIEEDPLFEQFRDVLDKFQNGSSPSPLQARLSEVKEFANDSEDSEEESTSEEEDRITSKRQLRLMNKIPLADLKSFTDSPHLVEWYDADAPDPYMLLTLKSQPNIVQVPEHWTNKRDYLSLRKGIDRPPFELPDYIKDTGIQDLRNNEDTTLKQDQRARVQPKMGKLDIDYQKLHDAFFKFQTKPRLLGFGDIYYEGRETTDEYDGAVDHIKPGVVSKTLRVALGLSDKETNSPPPWISIMQEIGKPPSYEKLVIPGIDVEYNNKGYTSKEQLQSENDYKIETSTWGVLEEGESSEEEDEDEDDNEEPSDDEEVLDADDAGEENDEPEKVHLTEFSRFKAPTNTAIEDENGGDPKSLYTVIKENNSIQGNGLLQGDHGYDLPGQQSPERSENTILEQKKQDSKKFKF